jgi:hypothetical protein
MGRIVRIQAGREQLAATERVMVSHGRGSDAAGRAHPIAREHRLPEAAMTAAGVATLRRGATALVRGSGAVGAPATVG